MQLMLTQRGTLADRAAVYSLLSAISFPGVSNIHPKQALPGMRRYVVRLQPAVPDRVDRR